MKEVFDFKFDWQLTFIFNLFSCHHHADSAAPARLQQAEGFR
jgi:hypothetical protein